MATIYAMSDIHGFFHIMQKNLDLIDLTDKETKLILCGDYIDYGPDSCKALYKIQELMNSYPSQVVVIKGNHETMFLEFLNVKDNDIWNVEWLGTDKDFSTVNTFISASSKEKIKQLRAELGYHDYLFRMAKIIKEDILTNHKELIQWLKNLPFYYETETQIFIHAGIDEEAEEYWKYGTPDEYFVSKFPATFGKFHKDIIAGHIGTSTLANDNNFHGVFWDKHSHYFIDGTVEQSKGIPLLKYDTEKKEYTTIMNPFTIMVWNINQRSNSNSEIPNLIINEISQNDIATLVEYKEDKEFETKLKNENDYEVFTTGSIDGQNEVLIAIKKGIEGFSYDSIEKSSKINSEQKILPNFLQVTVNYKGAPLTIIGTRIRVGNGSDEDFKNRKQQFNTLLEHIDNCKGKVLVGGDFNNGVIYNERNKNQQYEKGRAREFYNYQMIWREVEKINCKLQTPDQGGRYGDTYSIVTQDKNGKIYFTKEDHIISKNINVTCAPQYDWNFVKDNNGYGNIKSEGYKSGTNMVGLPDHAFLTASAYIIEPIDSKESKSK